MTVSVKLSKQKWLTMDDFRKHPQGGVRCQGVEYPKVADFYDVGANARQAIIDAQETLEKFFRGFPKSFETGDFAELSKSLKAIEEREGVELSISANTLQWRAQVKATLKPQFWIVKTSKPKGP